MLFYETNHYCALSKIAFTAIVDALNSEANIVKSMKNGCIIFLDVDSNDVVRTTKMVLNKSKDSDFICVIALLSEGRECPIEIKHIADIVVDKKIKYSLLKNLVRMMVEVKPKGICVNRFNDTYVKGMKSYEKEGTVVKLLAEGHSQHEIAEMLHMSIKTVSGYKMKAIRRHGARNFYHLYLRGVIR